MDLSNWAASGISLIGTTIAVAVVVGRRSQELQTLKEICTKLEARIDLATAADGRSETTEALQNQRISQLEKSEALFYSMRLDFERWRAAADETSKALRAEVQNLRNTVEGLARQIAHLAAMDRSKMIQFPPKSDTAA